MSSGFLGLGLGTLPTFAIVTATFTSLAVGITEAVKTRQEPPLSVSP